MLTYSYHSRPDDPKFGQVEISGAPEPAPKPTDITSVAMTVAQYNAVLPTLQQQGIVSAQAQAMATS